MQGLFDMIKCETYDAGFVCMINVGHMMQGLFDMINVGHMMQGSFDMIKCETYDVRIVWYN